MHRLFLVSAILCLAATQAHADHPTGWMLFPPRFAQPSDTGRSIGYHVGGGALPHYGEPRLSHEGTWGWDYQGLLPRRVIHNWWHGRRYQGGTGAYRTDGPYLYGHDEKAR